MFEIFLIDLFIENFFLIFPITVYLFSGNRYFNSEAGRPVISSSNSKFSIFAGFIRNQFSLFFKVVFG